MEHFPEHYDETTDLYLQMLRRAQTVEDKKLVLMLVKRMQNHAPSLSAFVTDAGCQIIPFPCPSLARPLPVPDPRFWLETAFWKAVGITVGMVVAGISAIIGPLLLSI